MLNYNVNIIDTLLSELINTYVDSISTYPGGSTTVNSDIIHSSYPNNKLIMQLLVQHTSYIIVIPVQ